MPDPSSSAIATGASSLPAGVTVLTIRPLYSSGQIGGATFLGSPLAGAWLLALNFQRLGAPVKARLAVGFGVIAAAALLAIGLTVDSRGTGMLSLASVVGMWMATTRLQGDDYARQLALGARRGSTWRALGVGVAGMAVIGGAVAALLGAGYLAGADRVELGAVEIRYTEGATRADAVAVGESLIAVEALDRSVPATLEIRRRGAVLRVVAFAVRDELLSDERGLAAYHELADKLSRRAFAGAPVDIWLTDATLTPRVELHWEQRPRTLARDDHHEVIYRLGAQQAEAEAVARILERTGHLTPDTPAGVVVTRAAGTRVVGLVVGDRAPEDPDVIAGYHALARVISAEAFAGEPVDIWLVDRATRPLHVLTWRTRP